MTQDGGAEWSQCRVAAQAGSRAIDGNDFDDRGRAAAHDDHMIGKVQGFIDIVGDHDHGGPEIMTGAGQE
ncbi:MAG: hypothetical protein LH616_08180, partial [Ilumatobacteraceae bacterium]|nr:hypothetical protein [Ilumatobacteraceae bacterium]